MENRQQRKSFPLDLFSSSFDKQARVDVANAQEQQRLVKRQRYLDLLKNDAIKEHTAAQTTIRVRSSNLSGQKQARTCTKNAGNIFSFPAIGIRKFSEGLQDDGRRGRNQDSAPSEPKAKAPVKLPFLPRETSSRDPKTCSVGAEKKKSGIDKGSLAAAEKPTNSLRCGYKKGKKLQAQDDSSVSDSRPRVLIHSPSSSEQDFIYPSFVDNSLRGAGLRRRSLSANDISLTGRVNAFLENLSLKSIRLSDGQLTTDDSDPEDEQQFEAAYTNTGRNAVVGLDNCSTYQKAFLNSRLEENGLPRYIRMPSANHDSRT